MKIHRGRPYSHGATRVELCLFSGRDVTAGIIRPGLPEQTDPIRHRQVREILPDQLHGDRLAGRSLAAFRLIPPPDARETA